MKAWSNLSRIVYKRTYSRKDTGKLENWQQTVERAVQGNISGRNVPEAEVKALLKLCNERKGGFAGRGYWFSGSPAHTRIGGVALNNCWYLNASDWNHYVIAQDLLMLGGGVGLSVEQRFTSKLPKVRKDVVIEHKATKDADFIVPDSREGWCELTRRVLESFFVSGRGFTYSTVCLRSYGEPIVGFGGIASGGIPLIAFIENLSGILRNRENRHIRPIDAADIMTSIGQMVVAGNVRRSAIIILGDCWDKEYLRAKRWDLQTLPTHRARANYSVICEDVDDLHPLFWKTYEMGEPFGIVNRKAIQKYGRMGELQRDTAEGVNPCVPAGTEILTDNGYLPIEAVVGQEINVWNGFEWSAVIPAVTGFNRELVTVLLSSGQSLTCTKNHKFVLADGNERVEAQNLAVGTKLMKASYPVIANGKEVNYAYTQGFISADGMDDYSYFYIYDTKTMCLDRMSVSKVTPQESEGRLRAYPSFDKHPKSFVPFGWDLWSRLEWLAGLVDGDGHVLKEGGVSVTSVNHTFLLDTQKLLTTLGVASKVVALRAEGHRMLPTGNSDGSKKLYHCQASYRLLIGAKAVQKLCELGLTCERVKCASFTPDRDASQYVYVIDVVAAGSADTVYCFTESKRNLGCFEGIITGQCAEATLENGEPCNLLEIPLCNLKDADEFERSARLCFRAGKRVTLERYHHQLCDEVVKRNRRVGVGITGCLSSPLFTPSILDRVYSAILDEDEKYSRDLGIPLSVRHTVVKPSGTMGKVLDCEGEEGIHAALAPHIIQRVQFSADDPQLPKLKAAGHHMEPLKNFDGSVDPRTMVVDFYVAAPKGAPTVETGWDMWKQLETLKMAQKHWADQAVSVTVYYKKEDIPLIKDWLSTNLQEIKSISFLQYSGHGFVQAPKEPITPEQYETLSAKIKPLEEDEVEGGEMLDGLECSGGVCPVR